MKTARIFLLFALVTGACSADPTAPKDSSDAGPHGEGGREASAGAGKATPDAAGSCTPFIPVCARGETCCMSDLEGTCQALSECTSPVQFECKWPSDCADGELCCATFQELADGGFSSTSFCQTSCAPPAHPTCLYSDDCPNGESCTPLPEGGSSSIVAVAAEVLLLCLSADASVP